jgi:hypothetical protein
VPVIAAEALLDHDVSEPAIRNYLIVKWLLSDEEARSAVAAARALGRDPSARTALPPDSGVE